MRKRNANEIVLAGLATDYCILHMALDARSLGYRVTVIDSGCRGIDLNGSIALPSVSRTCFKIRSARASKKPRLTGASSRFFADATATEGTGFEPATGFPASDFESDR